MELSQPQSSGERCIVLILCAMDYGFGNYMPLSKTIDKLVYLGIKWLKTCFFIMFFNIKNVTADCMSNLGYI
jgi:hypothetical protein